MTNIKTRVTGFSFSLILVFFICTTATALTLLGILPLDTPSTTTTERRLEGEVNVFLGVQTNNEGWDVYNLFSNSVKMKMKFKNEITIVVPLSSSDIMPD